MEIWNGFWRSSPSNSNILLVAPRRKNNICVIPVLDFKLLCGRAVVEQTAETVLTAGQQTAETVLRVQRKSLLLLRLLSAHTSPGQ